MEIYFLIYRSMFEINNYTILQVNYPKPADYCLIVYLIEADVVVIMSEIKTASFRMQSLLCLF